MAFFDEVANKRGAPEAAEEGAPEAVAVRLLSFSRSRAESAPAFPKLVASGAPEQTSVPRPQAVVDAPPP